VDETYLDEYRNVYSSNADKARFYPKAEITDDGIHGVRKILDGYELVFSLDKHSSNISVGSNIYLDLQHVEITKVGTYAYYHLTQEMKISFDDSVKEIDQHAFRLRKITSIDFNNVERIRDYAFYSCTSLKTLNTSKVEYIYANAFKDCTGLVTIEFPNVKVIEDSAFSGLSNLVKVSFDKIETIEANNFTTITNLEQVWFNNEESMEGFVCKGFVKTDQNNIYSIFIKRKNYSAVYNQIKGYGLTYRYAGDISGTYNKTVNGVTVNLGEYIVDGDENNGAITSCNYDLISEDYEVPSELTCITRDGEEITKKIVEVSRVSYTTVAIDRVKITFPESVKTIGGSAFEYWYNSDTIYQKKMYAIDFGGVETIGTSAFACVSYNNRSYLLSIKMPNVKTIGEKAFSYAANLLLAEFHVIESIGTNAFSNVVSMQQVVFYNNDIIDTTKLLSFPKYTTTTSDYFRSFKVFASKENLSAIKTLYGTTYKDFHFAEVGKKVGVYTYTRKEIPIDLGRYMVVEDGDGEGYISSHMQRAINVDYTVPSELDGITITRIGDYAYYGTVIDNNKITISDSIVSIGNYAFSAEKYKKSTKEIDFGGVQTIGDYAFYKNTSLETLDFKNVTSIGNYAFNEASSLVNIDFKNTEIIGNYAFQNCSSLKEIDFGNVNKIGSYCFQNCVRLVQFNDDNILKSFGVYSFDNCDSLIKAILPELVTVAKLSSTNSSGFPFNSCDSLVKVDIGPNFTGGFYSYFVSEAPNLRQFILRVEDMSQITSYGNFSTGLDALNNTNLKIYFSDSVREGILNYVSSNKYTNRTNISHCTYELGDFYGSYLVSITTPFGETYEVDIYEYCYYSHTAIDGTTGISLNSINYDNDDTENWAKPIPEQLDGITIIKYGTNMFRNSNFTKYLNSSNETFVLNDNIIELGKSAFEGTNIRISNLNNVIKVDDNAFNNCDNIYFIDAPNLIYAGDNAFNNMDNLLVVDSPNLIEVGLTTFTKSSKIVKLNTNVQISEGKNMEWISTASLKELTLAYTPNCTTNFSFLTYGQEYIVLTAAHKVSDRDFYNQVDYALVEHTGDNYIDIYDGEQLVYHYNLGAYIINNYGEETPIYKCLFDEINDTYMVPEILNGRTVNAVEEFAYYKIDFNNNGIRFPNSVKRIGRYAFNETNIGGYLDLNKVERINGLAFANTNIEKVYGPNVIRASQQVFENCKSLTYVHFPVIEETFNKNFLGCTNLEILRFGKLPTIEYQGGMVDKPLTIILDDVITSTSELNLSETINRWVSSAYVGIAPENLTVLVPYESLEVYKTTKLSYTYLSYFGDLLDDSTNNVMYVLENMGDYYRVINIITENTDVVIPDMYNDKKIVAISNRAFDGADNLQSITLPLYFTYYEDHNFVKAINLKEIKVKDGCVNFSALDGILYTQGNKELLCYPVAKENTSFETLLDTILIHSFAFENNLSIKNVIINEGIITIGNNAFEGTNLDYVEFKSTTVPYMTGTSIFDDDNYNLIIYAPTSALNTYKEHSSLYKYEVKDVSLKETE